MKTFNSYSISILKSSTEAIKNHFNGENPFGIMESILAPRFIVFMHFSRIRIFMVVAFSAITPPQKMDIRHMLHASRYILNPNFDQIWGLGDLVSEVL